MKCLITIFCLLLSFFLSAQDGYEIKITLKPFKNEYVYLGNYYGKQLPIVDSVKLNEKSEGVFKGGNKLGGGIYLIGYLDSVRRFGRLLDIIIDKNQKFSIIADTINITKIRFHNSPENDQLQSYQYFMEEANTKMQDLQKQFNAKSADSTRLTKQMKSLDSSVTKYLQTIINSNREELLPALLNAMKEPKGIEMNLVTKNDSLYAFNYYKQHYWDGVNFWDERLLRTPFNGVFDSRIDRYFDQLVNVFHSADSAIKEIDWMLGYASINAEMQKFLLLKFVNRYYNQRYMWEDAVFVHLFEKYFAQKNYPWLTEQGKKAITDRAYSLMANIFGNPASDIELPDINGKRSSLYNTNANYTLLAIWDPKCSHCKVVLPQLDSMYRRKWKSMGVKMFAMAKETDGTQKDWTSFVNEYKLNDWVHVYYSKEAEKALIDAGIAGYSQLFDVQSFPTLYLLDKDKRIIAKRTTLEQVDEILQLKQKGQ